MLEMQNALLKDQIDEIKDQLKAQIDEVKVIKAKIDEVNDQPKAQINEVTVTAQIREVNDQLMAQIDEVKDQVASLDDFKNQNVELKKQNAELTCTPSAKGSLAGTCDVKNCAEWTCNGPGDENWCTCFTEEAEKLKVFELLGCGVSDDSTTCRCEM